jgi:sugar phosphate isomerase/epimerase
MTCALIGWTGFVGLELLSHLNNIDLYNSTNIHTITNKSYRCIYFTGLPAEKWKINQSPEIDRLNLEKIISYLKSVQVEQFVLISTVDVLDCTIQQDELGTAYASHPYGRHRRIMEEWVQTNIADSYILRLPGLFGRGLKKNILYDLLHKNQLQNISLQSKFQWYNIANLYKDIQYCIENKLHLVHLVSPPIQTIDIVRSIFPEYIELCKGTGNVIYNLRYNNDKYWTSAEKVLLDIEEYINSQKRQQLIKQTLSISNIAWAYSQTDDILKLLKRFGITCLEIAPTKMASWDSIDNTLLTSALLKPCTYTSCKSIFFNTSITLFENPDTFIEHYRKVASICRTLGIKTVVFGSPKQRHIGNHDIMCIVPIFREIATISKEHNLLFCIEPNAKDYGCTWLTTISDVLQFIRIIDRDTIKLNLDTGNYLMEQDVFIFDNDTVSYIGNIQVSNRHLQPLCDINTTDMTITKNLIKNITDLEWNGTVSLEMRETTIQNVLHSVNKFISLFLE